MATGIEAVGLALAILPVVVNQVDNYARGLERIKVLRRYKWQLEEYSVGLSAQYAILLNTLELSLEGVVDDLNRAELIRNPRGPGWRDAAFEDRLADKLGRDYMPFTATVKGLCGLLEDLSHRLGLDNTDYSTIASTKPLGALKFRKIFSTAIYDDLLDKINKTNLTLKTLSEQSQHRVQSGPDPRRRRILQRHRDQRRHARALYKIMVQERQCWNCPCQDAHSIGLQLDSNLESTPAFHILISPPDTTSPCTRQWSEVKVQASESKIAQNVTHCICFNSQSKGKVKVNSTTYCTDSRHTASQSQGTPVTNLCYVLNEQDIDLLGYLSSKNATSDARYTVTRLANSQDEVYRYSLRDTLLVSSPAVQADQRIEGMSRQDSLHLATVLASSVFHFHGTWLQEKWGTQDILFIRTKDALHPRYQRPYLIRRVSSIHQPELNDSTSHKGKSRQWTSNEVLFPLALVLIELSLGSSISSLILPQDEGSSEQELFFNAATRLLHRRVYMTSGLGYGDVVKECLYWSRDGGFDDAQFDESVLDMIVSPLLKDFNYFVGAVN
ncbi:hypothetical protein N7507_011590 [Penicillium longicatenatum]|nr:hypothetical protein N7507_011590 [Penicillium longicatenatum]